MFCSGRHVPHKHFDELMAKYRKSHRRSVAGKYSSQDEGDVEKGASSSVPCQLESLLREIHEELEEYEASDVDRRERKKRLKKERWDETVTSKASRHHKR